ncbi:zinc-binding dehydrogenase family protein [Stylonychia lemnae]|uniref:Zinc-binding dehydrogenase family protein n=1 Tax=Stylonychia lemnae TaxID=5949 RepID=A0A078AHJ2_STYLE|nr:zinc-binding dehydrogenase family protein [Stylonychia lemnae]|eukprot:CDW81714.1 zinc-binding dehydrogenase family protein [Stylonychia lemnae]
MVEKSTDEKFMKAVLYTGPSEYSYSATTKTIPTPGPGQLLIKVECVPINPSDTYYLAGQYHGTYAYPIVPGGEGSGTVIASGGGIYAWSFVGKRVTFTRQMERPGQFTKDGTYAEYVVTNATNCITLDASCSFEQGANGVVNPLTALGLMERARVLKAQAIVQTGAASQLGRMVIKLARESKIPLINIVRRDEQVNLLQGDKYKQEYVLNSEKEGFQEELQSLCKKLNATVVFECVSGPVVGVIMNAIPPKSTLISYGNLSEQKMSGINTFKLIGLEIKIEGFLLPYWLKEKSTWALLGIMKASKPLLEEVQIYKEYGFHQIKEAVEEYKANMSKGKILLRPSLTE